jgi:hypothetical protein
MSVQPFHFFLCLGAEKGQVFFYHITFIHYANEVAAHEVSRRPSSQRGGPGFVVDKMALGQVFSERLGFSWQFSFHRLLHVH